MSLRSKLVALAAAAVVAISVVPAPALAAAPDTFVTSAYASHWGRSDLRAYLNGYTKTDDTAPLDSTAAGSNSNGYAAQFSESEYARIQPVTYSTNVLDANGDATSVYETTDRFYLPSGNYSNDQVIYWGSEDISANSAYAAAAQHDIARFIPVSYWSGGSSLYSNLRSAFESFHAYSLASQRGVYVSFRPVNDGLGVAPIMKVDINGVNFAAAASAAEVAAGNDGGSEAITIAGSSDFGRKAQNNLPDYGMYLKMQATGKFQPMSVQLVDNVLSVTYSGGVQGQYVVVQAYEEDSLEQGATVYAAAARIDRSFDPVDIDVTSWGLSSLDGYTVKVWMEDAGNGSSLAPATEPVTFVGRNGQIEQAEEGVVENLRVFATADELQTSWGDLSDLGANVGANPTNQKIYFGEKDGQPLQFWIAGRETAATGGEISAGGSTLVLYQAKSVEEQAFNQSGSDYSGMGAVTLQLADGQTTTLSGGPATYPTNEITFSCGSVPQDVSTLCWQHRASIADAWEDGMPTTPGSWQVRCCAPGVDSMYETTYSAPVMLTVEKGAPAVGDFDFTAPSDLTYDGSPKAATVTAKTGITGMGAVTLTYYEDGEKLDGAPTDAGTYTVKIDVAEGDSFTAASSLTGATWTFTIAKATVTYAAPSAPALQVEYGDSYTDFASGDKLAELLGKPMCGGEELGGSWRADVADGATVGARGESSFKAVFTPSMAPGDMGNYDWAALGDLWDGPIDKISVQVTVNASPRTMDEDSVSLTETEFIYSGSEQRPTVVISDTTKPIEGTDYDITWPTDATNAGQKTVEVAFKGNYTGTIELGYSIARAELRVSSATASDKTYDGTDAATVTSIEFDGLVNNEALVMGTDYVIVSASFADKDAGADKDVAVKVALRDTGVASNYELVSDAVTASADITRAPQDAPSGVTVTGQQVAGSADGSITGVVPGPAGAEWRPVGGSWSDVPAGGAIEGLAPSSYEVRQKGDANHEASDAVTVTVPSFSEAHGGLTYPDGTTENAGGLPVLPASGGTVTFPDGTAVILPGGTVVDPATSAATTPDGTAVAPDGEGGLRVTLPDGTEIAAPSGSTVSEDGRVTDPDGRPVEPPEDEKPGDQGSVEDEKPADGKSPAGEKKPAGDKGDALAETGDPTALLAPVTLAAVGAASLLARRKVA